MTPIDLSCPVFRPCHRTAADTFNCYNKYSDMYGFIVKLSKILPGEIFALDFESAMYYFSK